jgi:hypothetical protein
MDEARQLALRALERDPTRANAWRVLGFAEGIRGRTELATRVLRIAERTSRRDLALQLWLIEERVAQNDIPGALHHYDIALRTSRSSADILLPILSSATASDPIVVPLARLLLSNPPWRREFLQKLAETAPSGDNVAELFVILTRNGSPPESDLVVHTVHHLVNRGHFAGAWHIYRLARRPSPSALLLRNGDFQSENPVPPFDWRLESNSALSAERRILDETGRAPVLVVNAASGQGGVAAQQLLILPRGRYTLSARSGPVPGTEPAELALTVGCVRPPSLTLLRLDLATAQGRVPASSGQFEVPAGCPAQWLSVAVAPDFDPGAIAAWVGSVALRPARPGN